MFIEPNIAFNRQQGIAWIEVIVGSMFSGKTEELIRRLNRSKIAKLHVEIYKPKTDNRYHEQNVVSHDGRAIRSTSVDFANDILLMAADCDVVGIDEAQFFDEQLLQVARKLADMGKRVIIAGLDMDYKGNPFGVVPELMAIADFVTKVHAVCVRCGGLANYSYRKVENADQVLVGELDMYEPRCRTCYLENKNDE